MKIFSFVFAAVTSLAPAFYASAQEEALSMKGATDEQEFLFLAGAAQAIGYMNMMLRLDGKSPLFCYPANEGLGVDRLRAMADRILVGPHNPEFFIIAALDNLKKEYPCD